MNKTYRFTGRNLFEQKAETFSFKYFGYLMGVLLLMKILGF